ncbi:5-oxoprolinase subunit B family protein [Blastococcus sp. SYSU D00820]
MRLLPCGDTALLVEVDDLAQVLGLAGTLREQPPDGVLDVVPAARTVLLVVDPAVTDVGTVAAAVRELPIRPGAGTSGETVEIPVRYDGDDLDAVARHLRTDPAEVVRRHTAEEWTVAFCGFSPGFGYCTPAGGGWDLPRHDTPRTHVPAGAVALAGGFTGVYPRESPGGWQLLGSTDVAVFDLGRDPAALLRPGVRVRFTDAGTA